MARGSTINDQAEVATSSSISPLSQASHTWSDDLAHNIDVIRAWAASVDIVERVWLFGSRIRNLHTPEGDLDVAVEHGVKPGDSDHFTTGLCERERWADELNSKSRLTIDVWSYRGDDTPTVKAGVDAGNLLIYERL